MRFLVTAATTLVVFASAVSAVPAPEADYVVDACGAPPPESEHLQPVDIEASMVALAEGGSINVQTYIHIVTTTAKQGLFTQTMIDGQIATLNERYAPAGISFNLAGSDFTVNDQWGAPAGQDDASTAAMKKSLRKGGYGDLNLYFLSDMPGRILGWCNLPNRVRKGQDLSFDGCINAAVTLPGSTMRAYNTGITAVHEVGHWFGLAHVFNGNSCSADDSVADTPLQSTASSGCPASKDSCPGSPGLDSIHNYMDYTIDSCKTEWSPGQIARMNDLYNQFRASDASTGPAPANPPAPPPAPSSAAPAPTSPATPVPNPSGPVSTRRTRGRKGTQTRRRPTATAAPSARVSDDAAEGSGTEQPASDNAVPTQTPTAAPAGPDATATAADTSAPTAAPQSPTTPTAGETASAPAPAPAPVPTGADQPTTPTPGGSNVPSPKRIAGWRQLLALLYKDLEQFTK